MEHSILKEFIQLILEEEEDLDNNNNNFVDATRKVSGSKKPMIGGPFHKFDFQTFKQLKTYEERLKYLNSTAKNIGEGSSRIAYIINPTQVLKIAINDSGFQQNRSETRVCKLDNGNKYFTKIYEVGPKYEWLLTDFAKPMTERAFQGITGVSWKQFQSALYAGFESHTKSGATEQNKQDYQQLLNNPYFSKLFEIIKVCEYMPSDLSKLDSWGIVDGTARIIDYGFTNDLQGKIQTTRV